MEKLDKRIILVKMYNIVLMIRGSRFGIFFILYNKEKINENYILNNKYLSLFYDNYKYFQGNLISYSYIKNFSQIFEKNFLLTITNYGEFIPFFYYFLLVLFQLYKFIYIIYILNIFYFLNKIIYFLYEKFLRFYIFLNIYANNKSVNK